MRYAHIRRSDLNLLVSLQTLVEERSISRAARRMFLSQPAMSRMLDRLQDLFKDDLLVRTAKGYEPTHRASRLYAELEELLPKIETILRGEEYNPAEATDSFRIAATDHGAFVLVPPIAEALAREAPGIQIEISAWDEDVVRKLHTNALDLAFWVDQAPPKLRSEHLFQDEFACLLRVGHPASKRPLTLPRYLAQKHLAVSVIGRQQGLVDRALNRHGKERNVQMHVPYYSSFGEIVERTELVATLSKRLAKRLSAISNTVLVPAPKEFEKFTYIQIWHPRHDSDPAHTWFRELAKKTAAR